MEGRFGNRTHVRFDDRHFRIATCPAHNATIIMLRSRHDENDGIRTGLINSGFKRLRMFRSPVQINNWRKT